MTPQQGCVETGGIELAYFQWASESDQPPLVFAHATGFHARVWDAVIEHFPDRRVISLDLRGHGRSTGGPITHWQVLSEDVAAALAQLGIENAIGVGHSMGAHTLLQCAANEPERFSHLVLFDPVILAPEFYDIEEPFFTPENPHPTARRKRDFASPEAMMERFRDRDPFDLFDARVFEDYCHLGLLPKAEDDGYELACPPEVEASVYGSSRSNAGILEAAATVEIPTLIVRARRTSMQDFKSSPTWPQLASTMPNATDLHRPDMTHFHPFQDPADAARIIADFIAR